MRRNAIIWGLAVASCLANSGCSSPAKQHKYKIAVIPKGLTHQHWQSVHRGAAAAAAALAAQGIPVEILWDGPTKESDSLEQINLIRVKTGQGIHGLALAPQDSKNMVAPVRQTVKQGIPVVIIDSGLDAAALKAEPDLMLKYIATDNYNGGVLAAMHLLDVLAKAGKPAPRLALFRYQAGSESTDQREQGFLNTVNDAIKKQKAEGKPTAEIVADKDYAGATIDSAQRAAGPMLTRLQNNLPDGIFAVNESATTGLLNAMKSQRLNKKISLMGFDASDPLIRAIHDGDVDGTIVQDPYRMGYLSVWVLVRKLEGDNVSIGGPVLGTGEYVVTKENVDSEEIQGLFDPATQQKRVIKTPDFK